MAFRSFVGDTDECGSGGCGRLVTEAVAESLRARGITAELAANGAPPGQTPVVEGDVLALDEGNRAVRFLVGLGASRVAIRGRVLDPSGRLIGAFEGERQIASGKFGGRSEDVLRSTVRNLAEDFADRVATGRY